MEVFIIKAINFSAVEVLPSLLSKKKTQTIRPAWKSKKIKMVKEFYPQFAKTDGKNLSVYGQAEMQTIELEDIDKPARFKVGEKVKLFWNKRSKHKMFCVESGEHAEKGFCKTHHLRTIMSPVGPGLVKGCKIFGKVLGEAKITEVFQIEIGKEDVEIGYWIKSALFNGVFTYDGDSKKEWRRSMKITNRLAKKDGFKNADDMFVWFDKRYDLQVPKKFWVTRWACV